MKVLKKINDSITVEAEGATLKELFTQLGKLHEVFGIGACGCCKQTNIKFLMRVNEDYEFYEAHCMNMKCRAKLSYGVGRDDNLYPKTFQTDKKGKPVRKDGKKIYLPDGGWVKYDPSKDKDDD